MHNTCDKTISLQRYSTSVVPVSFHGIFAHTIHSVSISLGQVLPVYPGLTNVSESVVCNKSIMRERHFTHEC